MTAHATPSNRALFTLWGLFWVAMFTVAMQDASQNEFVRWWEPLVWEGSSALVATFWFAAQRKIDAHYAVYLDRPIAWFAHHLKWLVLIVPTFIALIYLMRHAFYGWIGLVYRHDAWLFVVPYEAIKIALFTALWLGVIFGVDSFAQWRSQRERLLGVQKALAESQLQQLQGQLRPHFLFNALNTISSLIHSDPDRADRLLVRLSDLLRASLDMHRSELTSLGEELRLLDLYAQIMQERFEDRVDLRWDIADGTRRASVPALLLQPLLENAFKHGVERSQSPVVVAIGARRDDDRLILWVTNTGTLDFSDAGGGIGLRNCRERLHVHYGPEATLELRQEGQDVVARIRLPWREQQA